MLTLAPLPICAETGDSLGWQRTWYNSLTLEWQPLTASSQREVYPINDWSPAFTFKLAHSNAFTHQGKLYAGNNPFCQYDMSGHFERQFSIKGVSDVWKATTDGKYVYMLEWEKKGIFVVDMQQQKVVSMISTPGPGFLYYIKYLPELDNGKGGFLTGNYNRLFFINLQGDLVGGSIDMKPFFGDTCVVQDAAVAQGKIYVLGNSNSTDRTIHEFDLSTLTPTGNTFDLSHFVGMAGVEEKYYPRTLLSYIYPDNKEYLMFVDYSGLDWDATSVPVAGARAPEGLSGYNLYRDGIRLNDATLAADTYTYSDTSVEQAEDHHYELHPVVNGEEQEAAYATTIHLADTRTLPLVEKFEEPSPQGLTRFANSYCEVAGADSIPAWIGHNGILEYYHSRDTLFHQSFVTRPLRALAGDSVKVGFSYSGNTYMGGLEHEEMTVEVSVDNGKTWEEMGSVPYHAQYGVFTPVEFDITNYVADKDFMVRLIPNGESSQSYNWQIDNLKVYGYSHQRFDGRVLLSGQAIGHSVNVTAQEATSGKSYSTTANADGHFSLPDMISGSYEFTFADSMHTRKAFASLDKTKAEHVFNLRGGRFTTSQKELKISLGENVSLPCTVDYSNIGDSTATARLSFEPKNSTPTASGNSNLDVSESWDVVNMFASNARSTGGFFYYNGKFYHRSVSYSNVELVEVDNKGNDVNTISLSSDDGTSGNPAGFLVAKGKLYAYTSPNSWSTPPVPTYLMPIDMESGKILASQKDSIDATITTLSGMGYNPQDSCLYALSGYNLYKLDKNNNIAETYQIPEWGYKNVAFDTYSKDGPYVWMAKNNFSPVGFTLGKYSLKTQSFVEKFDVNSIASSQFNSLDAYSVSIGASCISAGTDIYPGFFSLAFSQGWSTRYGDSGDQVYVFRLFPVEQWLNLVGNNCKVEAQAQNTFTVTFNTKGLKSGDVKQADITLSSDNFADNVIIPTTLTVDSSLNGMHPVVSGLAAKVNSDYATELSWNPAPAETSVDHYDIFREGEDIASTTTSHYADMRPLYGQQHYFVKAHFADGATTLSDTVDVAVENPEWGIGVDGLQVMLEQDSTIRLSWSREPEYQDALYEDFESYEPFITNGIGDWTLYDLDGSYTYGNKTIDYPNEESKMAGMIFDPEQTTPADESMADEYGNKMFAFTSSNVAQIKNNDWLVSPELQLTRPAVVSFRLRTRNTGYGTEKLVVKYSVDSKLPEDFVPASDTIKTSSSSWEDYTVGIPKEARYVALVYASQNTFQLFVDNIYIGDGGQYAPVVGYNVYRNEQLLNAAPQTDTVYLDKKLPIGDYLYTVETLYGNGGRGHSQVELVLNGLSQASVSPVATEREGILTFSQGYDRMRCYNASGILICQEGHHDGPVCFDASRYPKGVYVFVIERSGKTYKYKFAL